MEQKSASPVLGGLCRKLKKVPKLVYVCFALLMVLCIVGGIASWQYDNPVEERTIEYWTHNFVSGFEDVAIAQGEVLQKFTAGESRLTEFILLFENYASTDTANICVTLENKKGEEFYRWEVPVAAMTGEMFCLNAKVEESLQKGQDYWIRIALSGGESGITVRSLLKDNYKDELHPSVLEMTVNGEVQPTVLYMSQKYQAVVSYEQIWITALAVTLGLMLVLTFCKGNILRIFWEILNVVLLLAISYYTIELLSGKIYTIESRFIPINCLILLAVYLPLRAVGGRVAFYVVAILTLAAGVTNFYVLQFKGVEFLLTDLSAFSTAMSVADNYEFTVPPVLFAALTLYACVIILQMTIDGNFAAVYKRPGLVKRGICLALTAVPVVLVSLSIQTITFNYFTLSANFSQFGWWYSNVCIVKNSSMKKPADYSDKTVEKLLSQLEEAPKQEIVPQNLIVIMNEAWSDLSVVGDLETNQDYMPFVRNLQENTIQGNLHVATFGGGTCYSEYEFLTGNALRFMPGGSTPYAKSNNLPEEAGLASTLKAQGYRTVAMHPYGPTNWNRDAVYPAMGFDEFISIEDYQNSEYIRNYVSDKSDYDKIIEYYEAHQGEPLFVFNVTMQNHGGYDINNGRMENAVTATNIDCDEADTYLSLMLETDKAFEYLLDYFSAVSEPTMIVMFGDHQPALPESFYDVLYGKEESQRTEQELSARFITPYVIWTNYASDFAQVPDLSINYLGSLVLGCAGVELPQYNQFLLQKMKEIPVVGMRGIYDAQGQFTPYDSTTDRLLEDYKTLQYMRVEDRLSEYYYIFKTP